MISPRPCLAYLSALAGLALLSACGGGGGSSQVSGLLPPEQISVVTPVETGALPPTPPDFPADSDYVQDPAQIHVYDPAIEPLDMVNMILCLVGQTGVDQLVNQGPYLAQVNATMCEQGGNDSASETGQSSGSVDEFELWTVETTRASNTAAQSVHYWIPSDEEGLAITIFVEALLTHGVETDFPFGEFELDFAGATDLASIATPVFGGALTAGRLETGQAGFQLFFRNGDLTQVPAPGEHAEETAATVVMQADLLGGSARVLRQERSDFGGGDTGILDDEFLIAFDETTFLRSLDGGAPEAFHRTQFNENVWRYNLYYADGPDAGQRVQLDSGFGFRTVTGEYGWIGYWGMWTPEGVDVGNGDTITRDEFGEAGQDYTVFQAPGKLIRNVRRTLALTELDGNTFQWWYFDAVLGSSTNYVVNYDEVGAQWQKIGIQPPDSPTMTPIEPPEAIDTSAVGFLNMWSPTLGGPTAFVDGADSVTYYEQQFVNGSDAAFAGGDLTLYGYVQCLRPGVTASEAESGDVYLAEAPDVATPYTFAFPQADLTLYLDSTGSGGGLDPVGFAPGEVPSSGPYTWGMRSGPMVTDTAGLTSIWDVWNQSEFYVWETGPNSWNKFTGVVDGAGTFVAFDPPINFTYVQAAGDDRNGDDSRVGSTYFLNYGGPGQLWGLPQEGQDFSGDGEPDRWYPLVNLADGVLLGPTGTEYVVRALEIEQTLLADPGYAGALDLANAASLVLPTAGLFTLPDIGEQPVVTDAPRVVQGVVVGRAP